MPRIGETWRTRVGSYLVRLIADDAAGEHPLVGLIRLGDSEVAWNFDLEGKSKDAWDSGFDLIERAEPFPIATGYCNTAELEVL